MIRSFDVLIDAVKGRPKKTIAVAMAEEEDVLLAISHAHTEGIADGVLVGNKEQIIECGKKHHVNISHFDIVHAEDEFESVVRAIQLVRGHLADTLMKGKCSTATLLKGVLDKEQGLRSGKLLSHFAAFEVTTYPKLLFLSDAALNIMPDLQAKIAITENAVAAAQRLGIAKPKIALIAAVEKVNHDSMPYTADAAIISMMASRGQIKDAIIDGPLALDNAVSMKSCEIKGIDSPVGGDADILIMPDIVSANVFYKALTYLGQSKTAGIIIGAKVPIILTSRADSEEAKFLSIALGLITSERD
jgi:phosphate butyryltransferase